MMHPDTRPGLVNARIGLGVFATAPIQHGTIVFVRDPLDIEVPAGDPRLADSRVSDIIEKYSYIEPNGSRIVSWDHAKFVNHCCLPNTMSTGYGFEIAIRDIDAGEQITDEYGMFNVPQPIELYCDHAACRGCVQASDLDKHHERWDATVRQSLLRVPHVAQPLMPLLDDATRASLETFLAKGDGYPSVLNLRCRPATSL